MLNKYNHDIKKSYLNCLYVYLRTDIMKKKMGFENWKWNARKGRAGGV